MARKKIEPNEAVEVAFSARDRDLILEHTLAGSDVTDRLRIAEVHGSKLMARFTLDELDYLIGFIAAEANHTPDRKLRNALDRLHERLAKIVETYDDGQ